MKAFKIGLATIFVAGIVFFIIKSFAVITPPPPPPPGSNPFIDKVREEIRTLQQKPENVFCKEFYAQIDYHIKDYFEQGLLGNGRFENDQWRENLSKQLYAAYTDKFIKQAYHVFSDSEWAIKDLNFIRSEYRLLQSSRMLKVNSPIDKSFNKIKAIFTKYDEINSFINICKSYTFNDFNLWAVFPTSDVKSKIWEATNYQEDGFGNTYLNNCIRLKNEVKGLPQVLFSSYVKYLDNLITYWSNKYRNYTSYRLYSEQLYKPVLSKIETFGTDFDEMSDRDKEYRRLRERWEKDATIAYNHFSTKLK